MNSLVKNNTIGWPWEYDVNASIYSKEDKWPKISIITPSYNQGEFIEETILSILHQNYPNLEYIIIDGGSTDNTLNIIQKYKDFITYWCSEPDSGQAAAINKGFVLASGDIINWINSDDVLAPMSLFHIAANFDLRSFDLLAGTVIDFKNHFEVVHTVRNKNLEISNILKVNHCTHSYHQPGIWFSKKNIRNIKLANEDLHYSFDWELTLRYIYLFPKIKYINQNLVYFRYHNSSKTVSKNVEFKNESIEALKRFSIFVRNDIRLNYKVKRKLSSLEWHRELSDRIHVDLIKIGKWNLTAQILIEILKDPKNRLTRFTAGLLKSLLFNTQK